MARIVADGTAYAFILGMTTQEMMSLKTGDRVRVVKSGVVYELYPDTQKRGASKMKKLTDNQMSRLCDLCKGPSWLADQGMGSGRRATVTARAWWNTYGSLSSRGLCRAVRNKAGDLMRAFEITEAGRMVARVYLTKENPIPSGMNDPY